MSSVLDKLLASRPPPPVTTGEYGIGWLVELRFTAADWYRDPAIAAVVVDTLAATRWWPAIGADDVKSSLACGKPAIVDRGWYDDPDAALKLDARASSLDIMLRFVRGAVTQHADAVLADTIDAVLAIASRLRRHGRLAYGVGFPVPASSIAYPRVRPPRTALRRLDAVVDIVDPALSHALVGGPHVDDARAIGTTATPETVQRIERDGVIALRWVRDPAQAAAMEAACAAHERWIVPLIATEIAPGWNADGDARVFDEPDVVAPDRATALQRRCCYRANGAVWDPFPPGRWQ